MANSTSLASLKKRMPVALAAILTVVFSTVTIKHLDLTDSTLLTNLDMRWLDAKFRVRGERLGDNDIVIVNLEEKTLAKLGAGRVLERTNFATVVSKLSEAHPKAIGFDLTFEEPDHANRANDDALSNAIQSAGSVVLGVTLDLDRKPGQRRIEEKLDNEALYAMDEKQIMPVAHYEPGGITQTQSVFLGKELKTNLPQLTKAAASFGFVNFNRDTDGRLRSQPQIADYRGRLYPSLDLQLVRRFLDGPS